MKVNSTIDYLQVRFYILFLSNIGTISFLYCTLLVTYPAWVQSFRFHPVFLAIECWLVAETLFYFLFYLPLKYYLHRSAIHPNPPLREEREKLFERCWSTVTDPERYLSKWFRDASKEDIKQENVKEFIRWAFFNAAQVSDEDEEEVENYLRATEKKLGREIPPGRGKAKSIRLTLETVDCTYRSLFWYFCISVVDTITYCSMLYNGFQLYRTSASRIFKLFPFRPLALLSTKMSPSKYLTYWHREHKSDSRLPILFLHGIGVGLYPYTNFLGEINGSTGDDNGVGIIAIEIMTVSSRITHQALDKDLFVKEIQKILKHHGWSQYILIGHSYGTVICSHLLKSQSTTPIIGPVVLIDPICFLLHLPDVAYNFTFRRPDHVKQLILWYFGSKDIGVAHALARRFFWQDNILWKEDLEVDDRLQLKHRNVTVVLSGRDDVVNTEAVRQYLTATSLDEPAAEGKRIYRAKEMKVESNWDIGPEDPGQIEIVTWRTNRIQIIWFEHFHHAQVFDVKTARQTIIKSIRTSSNQGKKEID